jgi:hypothetical protein
MIMNGLVGEVQLPTILYFVVFSSKTAFFKLQDIFPECFFYRDQSPQIEPLVCMREDNACTVGKNCMDVLAKRVYILFEEVCLDADVVILYYRKRNIQGMGAGVFDREFKNPRIITMNPSGWNMVKRRGNIYQFDPSQDFFLSGQAAPPEKTEKHEDQLLD